MNLLTQLTTHKNLKPKYTFVNTFLTVIANIFPFKQLIFFTQQTNHP